MQRRAVRDCDGFNPHMTSINDYLIRHESFRRFGAEYEFKNLAPKVVCADGFTMSVQASETHYCHPRQNRGPYFDVEIGFPSQPEPLIMEYAEDTNDYTGMVYGYVPVSIVDAVIEKHGGLSCDSTQ